MAGFPDTRIFSLSCSCLVFVMLWSLNGTEAAARTRHKVFNCTAESGTFPDPYSCESYWICQYGNPLAASCNFGLIYSHKTLNCDWARPEVCTTVDGKIIRDWVPPPPPTAAPLPNLNADGEVITDVGYNQELKSDFSSVTTTESTDLGGSHVTRKVVQLMINMTKPGEKLPALNAYQQIVAKWKYSQKRLKMLQDQKGFVRQLKSTTRAPGLTGPPDFILPDSVTKAPRKIYTVKPVGDSAIPCDPKRCRLPDCYCDANHIPGGLSAEDTPQIVMVTFDDAVNGGNINLMDQLFQVNRTNPNGCPIMGTFFLANGWTDYNIVRSLYNKGHEVASHSLSHKDFSKYNEKEWRNEIVGEAEVANQYAGVNMSEIVGMRAPFLAVGGDTMYQMLWNNGFLYDSSIPSPQTNPPLWPYTLDSPLPHKCFVEPCPKAYFPGLWEVPMTYFIGMNDMGCSMYDACTHPSDEDDIADLFYANFMKHYGSNRSPYLLSAHSAWYQNSPARVAAMQTFMDRALKLGDVWFVTVKQTISWMQSPTLISKLQDFKPWQCRKEETKNSSKPLA